MIYAPTCRPADLAACRPVTVNMKRNVKINITIMNLQTNFGVENSAIFKVFG
jgi:hypothetical protein